ncbi:MAG: SDR family oxidoreductase [Burkholderiaceae bacterium]|nr:SDR family oxidoreductase [Burkholderiaceae bacterium]MCD8564519.1 SDR family oxidoreductase [Burkholderiaceae bacterium]
MSRHGYTLVTGATKGIGRALVDRLVSKGEQVVGISRSPDASFPGVLVTADLSDCVQRREALAQTVAKYPIARLVNNVGFNQMQALGEITPEMYQKVMDTNLAALVDVTQSVVPLMRERRYGRIVNIASRSLLGRKGGSVYSAAKAAMVGFTRSWALELARDGVTVNCVAPGPITTEMFERNNPPGSESRRLLTDAVPMGRMGKPEEVADLIEYVLSDGAAFITGQTIFVCGGSSISQQHF